MRVPPSETVSVAVDENTQAPVFNGPIFVKTRLTDELAELKTGDTFCNEVRLKVSIKDDALSSVVAVTPIQQLLPPTAVIQPEVLTAAADVPFAFSSVNS